MKVKQQKSVTDFGQIRRKQTSIFLSFHTLFPLSLLSFFAKRDDEENKLHNSRILKVERTRTQSNSSWLDSSGMRFAFLSVHIKDEERERERDASVSFFKTGYNEKLAHFDKFQRLFSFILIKLLLFFFHINYRCQRELSIVVEVLTQTKKRRRAKQNVFLWQWVVFFYFFIKTNSIK